MCGLEGAVPALLKLLADPQKGLRKEACWTLSNICGGNVGQIQCVPRNSNSAYEPGCFA